MGRGSNPSDAADAVEIEGLVCPVDIVGVVDEGLINLVGEGLVNLVGVVGAVGEGEYGVADEEESIEGMNGEQGGCSSGND